MAILTGLCSCRKNLLDVQPTNLLTSDQIVSNDGAVTAWAASLYRDLPMEDYSFIEGNFWRFPDGGTQYLANLDDESADQWNPGGTYMNAATYDQIYKAIRNVNSFIALTGAATANFPAAQIAQYVAEGKFIRAYCYYGLVKYYGGVPIVLDLPATPIPLPRNKETDVYDLIKTDLDAAAAGLPALAAGYLSTNTVVNGVTYGYGRANKWVALALESRVMLHAGSEGLFSANDANFTIALAGSQAGTTGIVGIDAAHGNTYMTAAFNASAAIIASNVFTLYNKYAPGDLVKNFEYLFYDTKQGDSNTESIFNRGYDLATSGNYTHSQDLLVLPYYIRSAVGYSNALESSCDFMDKFETTDGSNPVAAPAVGTFYHYPSMTAPFAGKESRYHGTLISNGTFFKTAIITGQKGVILGGSTITGSAYSQFFDTKVGSSTYKQFNADPTKFNAGDTYVVGTGNSNTGDQTTWLKKWTDPVTDQTLIADYKSRTSWMDLRYGEVLLDYAEASFELGHAASESQAIIDKIRARAGLPSIPVSRAVIRHERLVELSYENKSWWDYVRWRSITSDFTNRQEYNMDCYWDVDTNDYVYLRITNGGTRNFPSSMYYNNIPSSDLGTDALLIKNPGY